jgi:hypothetical protein
MPIELRLLSDALDAEVVGLDLSEQSTTRRSMRNSAGATASG